MKKEIIFKREEAFKEWLPKNKVIAGVNSYASKIKTIQRHFNLDVDDLLKIGIEESIQKLKNSSISSLKDQKSILRKYHEFTQSKD